VSNCIFFLTESGFLSLRAAELQRSWLMEEAPLLLWNLAAGCWALWNSHCLTSGWI